MKIIQLHYTLYFKKLCSFESMHIKYLKIEVMTSSKEKFQDERELRGMTNYFQIKNIEKYIFNFQAF